MDKVSVAEITAKEILGIVCETCGGRHSVRPYDFHRPNKSEWWVLPSSEWPAYVHAKFFFLPIEDTKLETGIYIEKGFSPELGYADKRFRLNPKWTWNKLFTHASQGRIDKFLAGHGSMKPVVEVHVSATRKSDVESDEEVREKYRFSYDNGRLAGELLHFDQTSPRLMEGLELYTSAKSLLKACKAAGFYWVDFYIGTECHMEGMSSDAVWKDWLSKLEFLYE